MRRVGGGYQFAHQLIGEHIGRRWPVASGARPTRQQRDVSTEQKA
jgi:hypothetical protein